MQAAYYLFNSQRHLRSAQEMMNICYDIKGVTEITLDISSRLQFDLANQVDEFPGTPFPKEIRWIASFANVQKKA